MSLIIKGAALALALSAHLAFAQGSPTPAAPVAPVASQPAVADAPKAVDSKPGTTKGAKKNARKKGSKKKGARQSASKPVTG